MSRLKDTATSLLRFLQKDLTAYDLFALTVAAMFLGHFVAFFYHNAFLWPRIPDRALLPVFLISVGFNSAKRPSKVLWGGAVGISLYCYWLFDVKRLFAPAMILITQMILEPVMNFLVVSRMRLWSAAALLMIVCYRSQIFLEFGTMILIFGMAGWINVNRAIISKDVVKPWEFFVFSYIAYSIFVRYELSFDWTQAVVFQAALAVVMWLMLDFRRLLLNSIRRKPKDALEKLSYFLGHKSMVIYIIQQPVFLGLYYLFYEYI